MVSDITNIMKNYQLFINNEFVETKEKQRIINPANGEIIAQACIASKEEVDLAIACARTAFDFGPWPRLSLKERKEYILKISQGILDKAGELAVLETQNNGKPIKESTFMDIPSAAETFRYFGEHLEEFLVSEGINISTQISQARAEIIREPMGVAALIIPWNYPLLIASWKLAQALAAGNTVVLKPSSLTPLTVLLLGEIICDVGLPKGVVNIINGSGDEIGSQIVQDKRVDLVSFTGSNGVGKNIIENSSKNVKKLLMELGGKSASVVLKDADLEAAVNGSLCSIFLNQGQMCTAMSRIFVQDEIYDKFLSDFTAKVKRIKLGPGSEFGTQMGPLVSEAQRKKVLAFVENAKKEGAKLFSGGKIPQSQDLKEGFFFEPTIFTDVLPEMSIFKEEVFGPVVCVSKFSNLEEAVRLANKSDFALAGSIWSKDSQKIKEISSQLNAGTIWINTYGMFFNELPYGGFKQSGFGKELGREGFLEYTRSKTIVIDQAKDAKPLVNYWYGF